MSTESKVNCEELLQSHDKAVLQVEKIHDSIEMTMRRQVRSIIQYEKSHDFDRK